MFADRLLETALASRGGTPKGEKDEADMFLMLVVVANRGTSPERVARIGDDLVSVLHGVCDRAAGRVAGGNAHLASILRARAREGLRAIEDARPGPGCRL
jgi:Ca2+/Na+ antiporter